jgi:outer membrane lipoprotein SlyB
MAKAVPGARPLAVLSCLTIALAACAPTANTTQPALTSTHNGTVTLGVVTSVRPIVSGTSQNGIQPGVNDVMAALQEPAPSPSFEAREYIIRRNDGNTTSIVTRIQTTSATSGDAMSSAGFSVGDPVEIVRSGQTELVHAN